MGMVPGPLSGPWTRGGRHRRPRMGFRVDHVFGPCLVHGPGRWFAGPSSHGPSRVGHVFGPPNGPWSVRVVHDDGPSLHGPSRGPHDWSGMGPLVHSHDVDRKRAGHVGGPPASTWSIWPLVQGPGLRPWPTRRGLIVDRAVLDGPWSWLTPSSASDRPVRPAADTRRLRQDLFYSSCRAPVNSMSQTIIRTPGHSRHRRACIPCRTRRPCRVLSRRPFFIRSSASRYRAKSSSASVSRRYSSGLMTPAAGLLFRMTTMGLLFPHPAERLADPSMAEFGHGHEVVQCDVSRHSPCSNRFNK